MATAVLLQQSAHPFDKRGPPENNIWSDTVQRPLGIDRIETLLNRVCGKSGGLASLAVLLHRFPVAQTCDHSAQPKGRQFRWRQRSSVPPTTKTIDPVSDCPQYFTKMRAQSTRGCRDHFQPAVKGWHVKRTRPVPHSPPKKASGQDKIEGNAKQKPPSPTSVESGWGACHRSHESLRLYSYQVPSGSVSSLRFKTKEKLERPTTTHQSWTSQTDHFTRSPHSLLAPHLRCEEKQRLTFCRYSGQIRVHMIPRNSCTRSTTYTWRTTQVFPATCAIKLYLQHSLSRPNEVVVRRRWRRWFFQLVRDHPGDRQ